MLRHSLSRMPTYWQQTMPPFITEPVMRAVVDPRLRSSLERLARASDSAPAQAERWWRG